MILTGKIKYQLFAEGTKSESLRPYLVYENGTKILLYKKNDNPFENNGFKDFADKNVSLEGDFENGVFSVFKILENSETENSEEK